MVLNYGLELSIAPSLSKIELTIANSLFGVLSIDC